MLLTLILCTYNRPACMERLLGALEQLQIRPDQIVIADASSDNKTKEISEKMRIPGLEYHRTEGFNRPEKLCDKKSTGDIVGFFDDDIVPDHDFFDKIKEAFENNSAGCIVPYIYECNELAVTGFKGVIFRFFNRLWGSRYMAIVAGLNYMPDHPFEGSVDNVPVYGCSFYRKEVFSDFSFAKWMKGYSYGEDFEFGLRIGSKYKIIGCGDARIHHYHEQSGRESVFKVAKMRIYNFVRIVGVSRQKFLFLRKADVLHRRFLEVVFSACISLFKLKISSFILVLCGGIAGYSSALPLLFKSEMSEVENE